jgi:hypothetical protein
VAILSTFYDTSAGVPASLVTEVKWAKSHPHVGASLYGILGASDFKVTAHPSTPYAVNVAAGKAWGRGVWDESDSTVTVTCPSIASGTRWDLICIRRNWGPLAGGPTTVTSVQGGTTKALPAGRQQNPGTLDDQPIALVQWTFGQTQPTAIVDLRCWAGNGGMLAKDELVMGYLNQLGSRIKIGADLWAYELLTNDVPGWVNEFNSRPKANITLNGLYAARGDGNATPKVSRSADGVVILEGVLQRANGTLTMIANTPYPIGTIPAGYRPLEKRSALVQTATGMGGWGRITVSPAGAITFETPQTFNELPAAISVIWLDGITWTTK